MPIITPYNVLRFVRINGETWISVEGDVSGPFFMQVENHPDIAARLMK